MDDSLCRLSAVVIVVVVAFTPAAAQITPPTAWELKQNDPEPFCVEQHGITTFTVLLPETAHLELLLWSADSTHVIATLMDVAVPAAGVFSRFWDGALDDGSTVPEGEYVYTLVAADPTVTTKLYTARKVATVFCPTPTTPVDWGQLKRLFR